MVGLRSRSLIELWVIIINKVLPCLRSSDWSFASGVIEIDRDWSFASGLIAIDRDWSFAFIANVCYRYLSAISYWYFFATLIAVSKFQTLLTFCRIQTLPIRCLPVLLRMHIPRRRGMLSRKLQHNREQGIKQWCNISIYGTDKLLEKNRWTHIPLY